MPLPPELATAIAAATEGTDIRSLARAAKELSDAYRAQRPIDRTYMTSAAHRLAYANTRLPATYATTHSALSHTIALLPSLPIASALDLASGPATASWAATQVWPSIDRISLIEQDPDLISLGKQLASDAPTALKSATWHNTDLTTATLDPHDLVICSYAIGELTSSAMTSLIEAAWQATRSLLVLIEPGTVPGFARIKAARAQLIESGAYIVAPCPHANTCPMPDDDWCHFSKRLDRSSLHRHLKSADMGHEDEKFSYIAVSREPVSLASGRILRHPQRRSGHARISVCLDDVISEVTVTRSQKANWKRLRRKEWGDQW